MDPCAMPATRSRVAKSPGLDNLVDPTASKRPFTVLKHPESCLRASAASFTPRTVALDLAHSAKAEPSRSKQRTASGTAAAKTDRRRRTQPRATSRSRLGSPASSTYSSRTHTPLHTLYNRRYTPSPVSSCRSSIFCSSYRPTSPVSTLSSSSRAASPLERREPLLRPRPISSSRRLSHTCLPDLDGSLATSETSPPTSLSTRNTPLGAHDGPGIVITSEEQVERLFKLYLQPVSLEEECGVLIDLKESEKTDQEWKDTEPCAPSLEDPPKAPLDEAKTSKTTKPIKPRATLISVTSIDEPLIDLSESAQAAPTPQSSAATLLLNEIRARSERQQDPPKEAIPSSEPLLLDLSDDSRGMGKGPTWQAVRSTPIGTSFTTPYIFTMSKPGPSRPSNGRRPESPRHARPPRPAKDRGQSTSNGQLIDLDVDLGSVVPRTHRLASLTQPRPGRTQERPTQQGKSPHSSRPSSPTRLNSDIAAKYKALSPYRQLLSRKYPQRTIPPELLDPGQKDWLQWSLMRAWKGTEPKAQQKEYITRLLDTLSDMINDRLSTPAGTREKGKRRFEVDVFGSVSWGGETGASGDLDLIVLVSQLLWPLALQAHEKDHQMPFGYHPSKWRIPPGTYTTNSSKGPRTPIQDLPAVYRMRAVERELANIGMRETFPIISATTPIVKFKEPSARMECDINVNDLGGWFNSSLILHYCLISPHVLRPMIYALKLWAKAFDLNDPSGARGPATLSSYCLTLMAIAYLQHQGVLPNLQGKVTAKVPIDNTTEEADTIWVGWGKDQGIKAHIGFERSPPPGWKPARTLSAAEAVRGFFSFFNKTKKDNKTPSTNKTPLTDRFDYNANIVSILQGGVARRLKPPGGSNREEALLRNEMVKEGQEADAIKEFFRKRREEQDEKDTWIGKGDGDMQPRAWEERTLIVQDPFLWQKNCAAALSKDGGSRFFDALEHTDKLLKSSKEVTLDQVIIDPLASSRIARTVTPRRGSPFGRGGRGRGGGSVNDAGGGSRTNSPRPPSTLGTGRGRGSPYDAAHRGVSARGRGRGGGGRSESLLDRLDI